MRRSLATIALAAALCILAGGCARYVYYPTKDMYRTPAEDGMSYSDLTLTASDGVRINAWYVPYPHARGTVLFCHGNAGNLSDNLQTVKLLRSLGLSVMIFDYRGYGKSEGSPSEKGTYLDALAAWDYLTGTLHKDPSTIIVQGRSLGGAIASYLAVEKGPGACILESTFTSMDDMANRVAGTSLASILTSVSGFDYDNLANCRRMRCPTLIIHSRQDEVIPYDMGRTLYEALPVMKKDFVEISGRHNTGWLDSSRAYSNGIQAFLAPVLAPPAQPHAPAAR